MVRRAAVLAGLLLVLGGAAWALWPRASLPDGVVVWGLPVGGRSVGEAMGALRSKAKKWDAQGVRLVGPGGKKWQLRWSELGIGVDMVRIRRSLRALARGWPWERWRIGRALRDGRLGPLLAVDSKAFLAGLARLAADIDRPFVPPRLDFRHRKVVPGRVGYRLERLESAVRILEAARGAETEVQLAVRTLGHEGREKVDISTVLGWYETPFKSTGKYRNRAYNLRLAARKLNGYILWPGQVLSFNAVVGPRTEKEGYRIAPVISRGEMVDGMAGGACQISSTLFAAAFFAGLEILEADVHSQPSHYIELGLDATVVWPDKDLKIKNPYDFPVVVHYEVAFGRVRTEILGPRRPYRIAFERSILATKPYREEYREDPDLPLGQRVIEQRGEFGYTVRRRRVFFDSEGVEVRSQYWTVVYPPTTLIVRVGTKPPEDPGFVPEPLKPIPPKPMPRRFVRILQ